MLGDGRIGSLIGSLTSSRGRYLDSTVVARQERENDRCKIAVIGSETDGSAVAVLTYLEAVLEVLHDNSDFAAVVFATAAKSLLSCRTSKTASR
jgi:hypothetical protein